jgi:fibronectin-binding autotransporter adhesin
MVVFSYIVNRRVCPMITKRSIVRRAIYLVSAFLVAALIPVAPVHALQLTGRSLTLSSSAPSAAATSYTFGFTVNQATTIKSVSIDICDSASGTCTPSSTGVPTGLTTTGAAVGSISGIGSGGTWTGSLATNGRLRATNNSNTGTPTTVSMQFTGITNPSTANSTYYARITTYSDNAYATPIDTGTVAVSTANLITVSASVDETLTFCTGTSGITNSSCAGATGTAVNLGALTTSSTGSGTSQVGVSTNANTGYAITVAGNTLTSGANTVTALVTQTASSQGSSQFGINLKSNSTPSVGSDVSGAGTATATANYNTTNQYRFVTGDQIASKGSSDNFRLFTVSYVANIAGSTPAGSYTTSLTYVATATF